MTDTTTKTVPRTGTGYPAFGTISVDGRTSTVKCAIKEVFSNGARLRFDKPQQLPRRFFLLMDNTSFTHECEVFRAVPHEICVRFLNRPAEKAQTPAASKSVPTGSPKGSSGGLLGEARAPVFGVHVPKKSALPAAKTPPAGVRPETPQLSNAQKTPRPPTNRLPNSIKLVSGGPILIAEDDPDDRLLIQDAFEQCDSAPPLEFVRDGQELMEYLNGDGDFLGKPWPSLILLDLNMPRVDGRKALVRIKNSQALRSIPVIILTTSNAEMDIERTYELGASSFVQKPNSFDELVDLAKTLVKFWANFAVTAKAAS